MREWNVEALSAFDQAAVREVNGFAGSVDNGAYFQAAELILEAQEKGNRVHITGIGKPGHVAAYGASLLSSTGTPTYFLHGTEAVHGSCGQLLPGDVVIAISNSGETAELKATVNAIKNNGCTVIAITGNPQSWLAQQAEAHLFAGVKEEGDPLDAQGVYPGGKFRDTKAEPSVTDIPQPGSCPICQVASRRCAWQPAGK